MKTFNLLDMAVACVATMMLTVLMVVLMLFNQYKEYGNKLSAANAVIETVIEDNPDYYLDVLCETDVWDKYYGN